MATQNGNGRAAPADERAEASLLGIALIPQKPYAAALVATFDPEDFYSPAHKTIAGAIGELHRGGHKVDTALVASHLNAKELAQIGGFETLTKLVAEVPSTDNGQAYADRIIEARRRRKLIAAADRLADAAYTGKDPGPAITELVTFETDGPRRELQRSMLGDLIRTGVPEPTMVHPWLYAGGLHAIQSEPGVGKTWVIGWMAVQQMMAGWSVVYLDEEGGEELIAERLAALGADPEMIDRLFFYFPFPERRWTDADLEALRTVIADAGKVAPVAMGVLDSLPDFLAAASKDEDSGMDVTSFARRLLTPFREVNAALVVLDHVPKPAETSSRNGGTAKRSRYGRGSGAKLAKTHATLLLETAEPFDREHSGKLHLWASKDRRGFIGLPQVTAPPLQIEVHVQPGRIAFEVGEQKPPDLEEYSAPTRCMDEIVATLKPGEWLSTRQLETIMSYKTATVRWALRELADHGLVQRRQGPRKAIEYTLPGGEPQPVQEKF